MKMIAKILVMGLIIGMEIFTMYGMEKNLGIESFLQLIHAKEVEVRNLEKIFDELHAHIAQYKSDIGNLNWVGKNNSEILIKKSLIESATKRKVSVRETLVNTKREKTLLEDTLRTHKEAIEEQKQLQDEFTEQAQLMSVLKLQVADLQDRGTFANEANEGLYKRIVELDTMVSKFQKALKMERSEQDQKKAQLKDSAAQILAALEKTLDEKEKSLADLRGQEYTSSVRIVALEQEKKEYYNSKIEVQELTRELRESQGQLEEYKKTEAHLKGEVAELKERSIAQIILYERTYGDYEKVNNEKNQLSVQKQEAEKKKELAQKSIMEFEQTITKLHDELKAIQEEDSTMSSSLWNWGGGRSTVRECTTALSQRADRIKNIFGV